MVDPDPRMAGSGIERLREAGLTVHVGLLEKEYRIHNKAYLMARINRRPLVTLKVATTLDGRVCDADGASQWITGETARACGQMLRSKHDAILVGVGTVLQDDPSLNVRLNNGAPIRPVILDTRLRTPIDAKIHTAGLKPWFYAHANVDNQSDWDVTTVQSDENGLSLEAVLANLYTRCVFSFD